MKRFHLWKAEQFCWIVLSVVRLQQKIIHELRKILGILHPFQYRFGLYLSIQTPSVCYLVEKYVWCNLTAIICKGNDIVESIPLSHHSGKTISTDWTFNTGYKSSISLHNKHGQNGTDFHIRITDVSIFFQLAHTFVNQSPSPSRDCLKISTLSTRAPSSRIKPSGLRIIISGKSGDGVRNF